MGQVIEHIGFLLLLILSVLFNEERLLADSGYYLIQVINSKWFWIEHNRLILILPEIAPVLAVWLNLSLKWTVVFYSVGHIAFFYLVYWASKRFGNPLAGAQILLLQVLGISSGFFVPMFELYYAAGLLILFDSIGAGKVNGWQRILLQAVLVLFIASAHFFAIALLIFILAYRLLESRAWNIQQLILFASIVAGTMIYKKHNISEYEQGKIDAFISGLESYSPTWDYLQNLSRFMATTYPELLVLSLIGMALFAYNRRWTILLLYMSSMVILTVMITVTYVGFEPSRYQEQVYFPLSFVVVYVFCSSVLLVNSNKLRSAFIALGILVLASRTVGIVQAGEWFTDRQQEMKRFIARAQDLPGTKFAVHEGLLTHDANWSYPIESLLISAADENLKTVSICTDMDLEYNNNGENLKQDEFVFRRYEIFQLSHLNHRYFKLDTTNYQWLTELP
jgi:hypothetical protein